MANTTWSATDKAVGITLTGSNLIATNNNGLVASARAADRQLSGKFYFECTCNTFTYAGGGVGLAIANTPLTTGISLCANNVSVRQNGPVYVDSVASSSTIGAITSGTVVCIAVDCVTGQCWFRSGAAGNWNGAAGNNPATGVGGISSPNLGAGFPIYPWVCTGATNDRVTANFGDTAFVGAVPAGFTSGFTAGATVATNTIATQAFVEQWGSGTPAVQLTQAFVEHWGAPNPDMQITQIAMEHWGSGTPAVQLTQIAIEHWGSVATVVPPPSAQNILAMVLA